jgi:hypothetical protein
MSKLFEELKAATDFIKRRPKLEGSHLLKKESDSLLKALEKYNAKAGELDLSFTPGYTETAALIEGDAKSRVTVQFIKDFTRSHCSTQLVFEKADKKARTALLTRATRDGKLQKLQQVLDQRQRFRDMYHELLELADTEIKTRLLAMPAKDFCGLVTTIGLDAPRLKNSAVSASKASREKVLKQILRDKTSEELMSGIGGDV